MTKDEIYDHLANVYLGKKERPVFRKKPPLIDSRQILRVAITLLVLGGVFYGLTAFLPKKGFEVQNSVIFSLNNNPLRIKYDLNFPFPQVSQFSIPIPRVNAAKYKNFSFSMRGMEEGFPGVVKIILRNKKNEQSYFFIDGVKLKWRKFNIPLERFNRISDWTNLTDISFVFEAWNAEKKKGIVLIDDICFSNAVPAATSLAGGARSLILAEK